MVSQKNRFWVRRLQGAADTVKPGAVAARQWQRPRCRPGWRPGGAARQQQRRQRGGATQRRRVSRKQVLTGRGACHLTEKRLIYWRDVIGPLLEESYQQPKMLLHAAAGSGVSGDRAALQRGAGLSATGNMLEVVVKPFMEEYRKSIDLLSPYA